MDLQTHPLLAGRAPTRFPRPLAWAMAVSLCAHALLLWPSATRTVRPLLHASLRAIPVTLAETPAELSFEPPPVAVRPTPAPFRQAAAARKVPGRPKPIIEARPLPVTTVAESTTPDDSVASVSLVDVESLRSYRIALALNARRFHQYPAQAIELGHSGTAQVRIAVAQNGLPGRVELVRSSGHDVLDREAREMLARAAQATALPDVLRGQAFSVDLPVEFLLPAR